MKSLIKVTQIAMLVGATLTVGVANAQSPLEKALAQPGAKPNIPVTQVKEGFDKQFIDQANASFGNFHMQMGGDHALYYAINMSKYMPAELAMPHGKVSTLTRKIDESLNDLTFTMGDGKESVSLKEYIHDEKSRVQGIMILKGGKVVYEEFPGMNPEDTHLWASVAKSSVGTILTMLEVEGKVDMSKPVTDYVPELKGTEWDSVIMIDAMNMASGLDISENAANTLNPRSVFQRMLSADFNVKNADGVIEDEMKVLRDVEPLEGEPSGKVARYSSTVTKVLGVAIENITQEPFTQVFEDRIWSKIGARASAQINITPAGHAVAYGLINTRLDDLARYGLLFTPSWDTVSNEQVVSKQVLEKMQTGGNSEAYLAGDFTAHSWVKASFGKDMPVYNTHQWDAAWEDGALFKHGNLYQNLYVDPARDVVGVAYSTSPVYLTPDLIPGYLREAAKQLADK
ncbi:serine hydrolase domain-containing protein [Photobacterium rosenbergii]|uniref:serine hydrolase domain-containing protein n=1 Tax=Photobacterium rosenbergii TaxID=294936 RepID=UPI001C99A8C1|nr:serine hydrolase domain-containing protein [Photobacterium rosenbergii]MBY5947814.1 beta-lactamase family protein [Photobacterium rosenbergii]